MFKRTISITLAAAAIAALGACATIVGSPTQLLPISSTPDAATITVTDEKGTEVFKGSTPTTVTLAKSNGGWWAKKSYTVSVGKPGFQSQVIPITSSPNGWYMFGNFFFGGLIGWLIVDPQGGHMYTLSPELVSASLTGDPNAPEAPASTSTHNNTGADRSISIVLLENVPADLRARMQPLR